MTLTTEELAGTTVASAEENGDAEARAEVGREGPGKTRRIMRCGDWIRLGDVAADVVQEADHASALAASALSRRT